MNEEDKTSTQIVEETITMQKSKFIALVLWFFFGSLGGHRYYCEKTGTGVIMLVLSVLGWLTAVFYIGILFLIAVGIWLIVDLVKILTGSLLEGTTTTKTVRRTTTVINK